ncbi:MAG: DUF4337 domain-containing protein [Proteobacteria bacterium]|nr:DUF4337 domain-containing protein [Pseudomonadota bacterium]
MEVDPIETVSSAAESPADRSSARLNIWVALSVAILATFMGICKVKDDNIVQAMQQAQADKLDHWAYYQARSIRQEVAEATVVQLRLARDTGDDPARAAAIAKYEALAADQAAKKAQLQEQAKQDQQTYDSLNYRDDQFDLSDALIAIAISLLAVTAVTRQWWLYFVALVPTAFGILMGLAGLMGWAIHPDALTRLLS